MLGFRETVIDNLPASRLPRVLELPYHQCTHPVHLKLVAEATKSPHWRISQEPV